MEPLVRRAQSGDREALRALCVHYHPLLCRYLRALTRSSAAAEDLAQDTLIAMLRGIEGYRGRPGARFDGWIFRIAHNLFVSETRKRRPDPLPDGYDPPDDLPSPEQCLERAQQREALARALDALDEESREMVVLRYEMDMGYRDIARTLGTTSARVKWRLHDALGQLRKRLEKEDIRWDG